MNKLAVGALALVLLVAAACAPKPTPEPVTINILMTEYSYTPAEIELQVGQQVTLVLTNQGALEHELLIGRQVVMEEGRPSGFEVDFFETGGVEPVMTGGTADMPEGQHEMHGGFMVVVPVGGEATVTFTVTEEMLGEWEMGCFLLEGIHYQSGMVGALTVVP